MARRRATSPHVRRHAVKAATTPKTDPTSLMRLVTVLTFLDTFVVGLVNPIYPTLVQNATLGATLYAGVKSSANGAALLAGTFFGRLSDVKGRRAAIVASTLVSFLGYLCYTLGYFCEGFYPTARVLIPAIGRVISVTGRSALIAPLHALLADHAGHDATSQVAKTMAVFGFGYAAGSGVGGILVSWSGGTPQINLAAIVMLSAVQVGCALLLPQRVVTATSHAPVSAATAVSAKEGWVSALRNALGDKSTRLFLLLQGLASSSFHVYDSTSDIYMSTTLGYSPSQRGFVLSYAGWVFAVQTLLVVPWLVSLGKFTKFQLLRFAYLFTAAGRFGLAAASSAALYTTPTILVSYAILNLGQGMGRTLIKGLVASAAAEGRLGVTLGVLTSVDKLVGVIAPLVGGPAYVVAPHFPAILAGVVGLAACAAVNLVEAMFRRARKADAEAKSVGHPKGRLAIHGTAQRQVDLSDHLSSTTTSSEHASKKVTRRRPTKVHRDEM